VSYVVESTSSQRSRKRLRTAVTLVVAIALLAGAFYYASTYFKKGAATSAACPTGIATTAAPGAPGAAPAPGQITVNVYNATNRNGLAGDTAKGVKERGYVVGTVSNDPLRKTIPQTAEVRHGKNGEVAAGVVAGLVAGSVLVVDARADASVDLVVGNGFQALVAAAPAAPGAPAAATAARATPRC